MYSARDGSSIAIRLEAGEDVHASLLAICSEHGVSGGYVVSGIGMLLDPALGWYEVHEAGGGQYHERDFPGRHELLNLSGNISLKDGEPFAHLHAICADEEQRCFGGHLFRSKVGLTLEVLIHVVGGPVRMHRQLEPRWGLPGLVIE